MQYILKIINAGMQGHRNKGFNGYDDEGTHELGYHETCTVEQLDIWLYRKIY